MATHDIQTVMEPWKTITVGDDEYVQLLRLGLVYSGSPVAPVADGTDLLFADKIVHGVATPVALKAAYASTGPTDPGPSLPHGTEYVWMKTDGSGNLLDILAGVA